ncbi:hypothetical protein [Nocardia sp. NPDC024068]|uniref:hypothetical protein n=1 Tax=Nocardia sp. NPDC024068 TaxID=3157197 RepID=UPI00340F94BB
MRSTLLPILAAAGVLFAATATATAAPDPAARTEVPVVSTSPVTSVLETVVGLRIPLPESAGPRPAACDRLAYLRWRHADGPTGSADADAVLIAQPGVFEGAAAFDTLARNTVAAAARNGRHIEFWALDRRSNCLEDHTGRLAALTSRDPHRAVDYYFRGAAVDGRTFAGYVPDSALGWLGRVGLAQTVQDQFDLLAAELPDPVARSRKVLCGGHSLGGLITGFFAEWDFAGVPGRDQCAGYFALDSAVGTSLSALSGLPDALLAPAGLGYGPTQAGLASGALPRALALPAVINPETMNLLGIVGLAAAVAPTAESDLARYIPPNANQDATYRILLSRDVFTALTGTPSVRDFRVTNAAALGAFLDANSQPVSILKTGIGFFAGGPVVDKDFPPDTAALSAVPGLRALAGMLGGDDPMAITGQPHGPLYSWRDYNEISGSPIPLGRDGRPFTTAADEVTSVHDLARSLAEHPLDFTEWYFPLKLTLDIAQSGAPEIARYRLHPGPGGAPIINLLGGSGIVVAGGGYGAGETVIVPGYHHLDVITAAAAQNGGGPEPVSTNLARFAARLIG